jgi:hypothetical protein
MNPLQLRLATLRRRLRRVVTFRGVSAVGALLLFAAALGGLLDWFCYEHHIALPSLVRALLLAGTLGLAGTIGQGLLVRPLRAPTDDLSLALQVEARYPVLNDALASAVQFLEQPADSEQTGSPSLRQEAVERALRRALRFDFSPVVDTRGVRAAVLSLAAAGTLALMLSLAHPQWAWTAFLRLAHPFGGYEWPAQTFLEINARTRAAKGEAFEIRGLVSGVIPPRATIEYRFAGSPPLEHGYEIARADGSPEGTLAARLEPALVQRSFRFQVRANDASTGWRDVEVLPPPQLVTLAGRPSPQIHLQYPDYTDLPAHHLPDGATSIEAVAGTRIALRAATSRPVVRAWLEYPPELEPALSTAAVGNSLGLPLLARVIGLAAADPAVCKRMPARLESAGQVLTLDFVARVSGTFALRFEDDVGLGNTRLIELRTLADPAPTVHLDRPSRSQDSFDILPDAEISLHVRAEDFLYAVRSVYLEYRPKVGDSAEPSAEPRRLPLYDHEVLGEALPQFLSALSPSLVPTGRLRLRPAQLDMGRRWSLRDLRLQEGDVLTIQACADDFDDVTLEKKPGRSHEIELHVVSRTALDLAVGEAQAQVQQELLRLHKLEQEALAKVIPAETHWRNNKGPLPFQDLDELIQAEQLQQQIRGRVGTRQEGVRAEVARILQTLRDNHLPRSGTQERMEAVAAELDRLAREELEQIEPRLTEARKESELRAEARSAADQSPLADARKHQEEVKKTLGELLKLLEPWSSTREVKGEAKLILRDQQKLNKETEKLGQEVASGVDSKSLTDAQKAELEKAAELQNQLAERTTELLQKLDRLAQRRPASDPDGKALAEAARRGTENGAAQRMQDAAKSIRDNQLSRAGNEQRDSARSMDEVVKALDDRREDELDRLIKKMNEAEQRLADLSEQQGQLRNKAAADRIGDPANREQELKRLAREQEKLQEQVQEMVRELSRLRSERAGQALGQAGGQMRQASRQMDKGDDAQEQHAEALDRLQEARRELQRDRRELEEELAREKLVRIADQIKGLRERQQSLTAESARIHREVLQKKEWTRPLRSSLLRLADAQKGLGEEAGQIAQDKLKEAKVFEHLLKKSAQAMTQASDRMQDRLKRDEPADKRPDLDDAGLDLAAERSADEETQAWQRTASRWIDQLLDALKPEPGMAQSPFKPNEGSGQPSGGNRQGSDQKDELPPVAQLKALLALQLDLNQRTNAFDKLHPERGKLSKKETAELATIHQEQEEVAALFQQLTVPAAPEGEKK